jgi:4-amino-4-deoxy-L-arabinose transferase-like glycosyltransferase
VLAREGEPGRARAWRFLLAWLGSAFVFFSLSTGKRGLYLLPVAPAAALLFADAALARLAGREGPSRPARGVALATAALLLAAGLAARPLAARFDVAIPPLFPVLWLALFGLAGWAGVRLGWRRRAALAVAGVALAEALVFTLVFPALDAVKSPRPVAQAAAALTRPDEPVGVTRGTLVGALVYYGGRRVAELREPPMIPAFLAAGGRVIVTEAHDLHRLEAVADVEVRFRAREGRRALVVVTAAPRGAAAAAP